MKRISKKDMGEWLEQANQVVGDVISGSANLADVFIPAQELATLALKCAPDMGDISQKSKNAIVKLSILTNRMPVAVWLCVQCDSDAPIYRFIDALDHIEEKLDVPAYGVCQFHASEQDSGSIEMLVGLGNTVVTLR